MAMTIVTQQILPMKKNDTINFLFLVLCVLLLGFVYLSGKMPEHSANQKNKVTQESVVQTESQVK